jgi:hypothetical protein
VSRTELPCPDGAPIARTADIPFAIVPMIVDSSNTPATSRGITITTAPE